MAKKKHAKKTGSSKVETSSSTGKPKTPAKKVTKAEPPVEEPVENKPEVKTLGAKGSIVPGSPSTDQLEAVVKEAIEAGVNAKIIVSDPADQGIALRLIENLNPENKVGVVLKENFGGRATWRKIK